jgi:hypothetical protein
MDSFFRFLIGFLVFIGLSFGVTYAVNIYTAQQAAQQQVAAALQAMLAQKK